MLERKKNKSWSHGVFFSEIYIEELLFLIMLIHEISVELEALISNLIYFSLFIIVRIISIIPFL